MNAPVKGPWIVKSNTLVIAEDGTAITITHATADNRNTLAELIGAAPELLLALKDVVPLLKANGFQTREYEKLILKAENR